MDCLQIIETAPKYGAYKENENKTKDPSLLEKNKVNCELATRLKCD